MSTDFNGIENSTEESDVYGDPETVLADVKQQVAELNKKVDSILDVVNVISEEIQPLIDKVLTSPMFKMLVGGK